MSIWNKMFGDESSKFIGNTKDTISKINALEQIFQVVRLRFS